MRKRGAWFRSEECVALLKEADIVVTNPPLSLFREYVAQLMEYGKKFLIIGRGFDMATRFKMRPRTSQAGNSDELVQLLRVIK